MKKVLIAILIAICMILGILITPIIGFKLGLLVYEKKHSHPDPIPRPVEAVKADLEKEMIISNALLDGLHWYLINDSAFWESSFVKTQEYKNIDGMVEWGDFDSPDWKAKETIDESDIVRHHY
ncbi:MAG: hypothetical protein IKW83_01525 [Muribaculaceae bacterium]|nr:hypothetical protein [Muribaculaceae bacterium]